MFKSFSPSALFIWFSVETALWEFRVESLIYVREHKGWFIQTTWRVSQLRLFQHLHLVQNRYKSLHTFKCNEWDISGIHLSCVNTFLLKMYSISGLLKAQGISGSLDSVTVRWIFTVIFEFNSLCFFVVFSNFTTMLKWQCNTANPKTTAKMTRTTLEL